MPMPVPIFRDSGLINLRCLRSIRFLKHPGESNLQPKMRTSLLDLRLSPPERWRNNCLGSHCWRVREMRGSPETLTSVCCFSHRPAPLFSWLQSVKTDFPFPRHPLVLGKWRPRPLFLKEICPPLHVQREFPLFGTYLILYHGNSRVLIRASMFHLLKKKVRKYGEMRLGPKPQCWVLEEPGFKLRPTENDQVSVLPLARWE